MGRTNRTRRSQTNVLGGFKSLFIVLLAFASGYWCSTWWDPSRLLGWVDASKQALSPKVMGTESTRAHLSHGGKPKLEFYTLLTKERDDAALLTTSSIPTVVANVPAGVLTAANTSTQLPTAVRPLPKQLAVQSKPPVVEGRAVGGRGAYLIQLAAFRARTDAERMKATLVIKGFDVRVTEIAQSGGRWYRVMIGPYASKERASQALGSIARTEHVTGMIRFVDA